MVNPTRYLPTTWIAALPLYPQDAVPYLEQLSAEAKKTFFETGGEPLLWACIHMIAEYAPTPPDFPPHNRAPLDLSPLVIGLSTGASGAMLLYDAQHREEIQQHRYYHPHACRLKKVLLEILTSESAPTLTYFKRTLTHITRIGSARRTTDRLCEAKEYSLLVALYLRIPAADAIVDMLINGDNSVLVTLIRQAKSESEKTGVTNLINHCLSNSAALSAFIFERKMTHRTGGGTTRPLTRALLNAGMHQTLVDLYCQLQASVVIPDVLMERDNSVLVTLAKCTQNAHNRPQGSLERLERLIDHCLSDSACLRSWINHIPWDALGAIDSDRMEKLRNLAPAAEVVRFSKSALKEIAHLKRNGAPGSFNSPS